MKALNSIVFLFLFFSFTTAQLDKGGGEFVLNNTECLAQSKRDAIFKKLQNAESEIPHLHAYKNQKKINSFIFPVKLADGITDPGFFGISNYVDHNPSFSGDHNDFIQDWNCGGRSYDTGSGYNHRGIDIFSWPFGWIKTNNDEVEIIAAEEGLIIFKEDGNADTSCDFCNNCDWNAVYLQHSDGTVSWYGHMKKFSLTSKNQGDMVSKGEYLGIMASSGNSTGPHLHFEVWENSSYTKLVDPYAGNCNDLNGNTSAWENQEDYRVPTINLITTGLVPPAPAGCPNEWNPNENSQFYPGDNIFLAGYYRDQLNNTTATYQLIRPDGTVYLEWQQTFDSSFNASWWWFNRTLVSVVPEGEWTYKVSYLGNEESIPFLVGDVVSNLDYVSEQNFQFYTQGGTLEIETEQDGQFQYKLLDVLGRILHKGTFKNHLTLPIADHHNGVYVIHIENSERTQSFSKKIYLGK